jgi:hypothetical protein
MQDTRIQTSTMYPDTIVVALKTLGFTTTTTATTTTADGVTAPKSLKELFGVRAPKSLKELNKRYHLLALKHHPDKVCDGHTESVGADDDGAALFKEINESHKRVKDYFYSDNADAFDTFADFDTDASSNSSSYDSIFKLFIKNILVKMTSVSADRVVSADAIHTIIQSILSKGVQSSVMLFRKMDKSSCMAIYNILSENQELFSISREIMDELTSIVEEKTRDDIVIRLNPSLLDMLLDRVYILNECGQTYYIPLWHSELHFNKPASSSDTGEIIVLCQPELPDHVTVDEDNNIYVSIDVNIVDLFRNQIVPVYITDEIKTHGFVYYLHATDVTCQSGARQCVLLRSGAGTRAGGGCGGIALLGTNHIYKVTERANVYAIIKLNCD